MITGNKTVKAQKGYTLLEIAVSLTIIGILVAIAAASVIPMATVRKLNEFKLAADQAMEWVDRFALQNRRLPTATEFADNHSGGTSELLLEYHVNSNIAKFNLPEMYLGYRINHNDSSNLVRVKPNDNTSVREDYAYYIDARFPNDTEGKSAYRQIKRYYPFLKLMGNGIQNNYVRIVTTTLPKGKRMQRYDANILITGGATKSNAEASDCNLGRDLDIAIGIRAPSQWHNMFSSVHRGTWNTIQAVKDIFNDPAIFLQGTDCDSASGYSHSKTNCDTVTLRANKMPAATNWTHLNNCAGAGNPTDYIYKISSMPTVPGAVYNTNIASFMQGKIPPYARHYNHRYPYRDTDYYAEGFTYSYLGSHFYFVVYVRDNNNLDGGSPVITQKTLRVNLDPIRGVYPPR
jgi:prepilin-type N-terminal cleavage/methylation domain-containing protein